MTNAPTLDPQAAIARLEAWLRENPAHIIEQDTDGLIIWDSAKGVVVAQGRGLLALAHALPRLEVAG